MSTDFKNGYANVYNDFVTTYGAESIDMSVLYALNRISFVLKISYTKDNTRVDGLIDIGLNTVSKDGLAIVRKNTGDTNGQKFRNEVVSLNDFLTQIASEYTLKTATKLNPRKIDFVKKTNLNAWFSLSDE